VNRRQILAIPVAGDLATVTSILAVLLVLAALPATAQEAGAADDPVVTPTIRNVTRVESWSFFEPAEGGGDPTYSMLGNRATLGMRVESRRLAVQGSLQYAQMVGLPRQSIGPGPLGPGPVFYISAENSRAFQLYFKTLSLRLKNIVPRLSLEFGRMTYESSEHTPFAARLIGNAEWSMFERAFDGARLDYQGPAWRVHGSFVMPTQGVFEESASPTIGRVQVTSASASRGGWEAFAHSYRDRRAIGGRVDNTGARSPHADITLQTVGSALTRTVLGVDVHLWGALQRGDWYGDDHRAWSTSAEARYQWTHIPAAPSISAGALQASGDEDPNDSTHGTFFPMVPTTTPSVLAATYAQMNFRDLYVRGSATPHDRLLLSAEVHRLSLAYRQDRWYSGSGATAFAGAYFGYSSRPSTLATNLGTFVQLAAESPLTTNWRLTATAGFIRGGDVVRRQFAGRSLAVFVLESAVSLP
jgi:hypothetical protein